MGPRQDLKLHGHLSPHFPNQGVRATARVESASSVLGVETSSLPSFAIYSSIVEALNVYVSSHFSRDKIEVRGNLPISKPGFANAFCNTGIPTPVLPTKSRCEDFSPAPARPYPNRPIIRPDIDTSTSLQQLELWATSVDLTLGPLVPKEARHKVLSLLYHYRHLNGTDLKDLPCTDLITHRVRITPGTKPRSAKSQKRWPAHTEWWLQKIISDGLQGGVYELTEQANGRLSEWNARAVVVDKVENPKPEDEPRVTFDYSRVMEDLPGTYLELSSKVHDNLSNPHHKCLFVADLKHAYLTIPLHPADRHYFAFTIAGIGQVQPTRMQQGSKSAGFTMTELIYRAFGQLPPPWNELSLLHSSHPDLPPILSFYMDDFFGGFSSLDELYDFLKYHFFPRIEWAKLKLSFKKLKVFESMIKVLGVTHNVGGEVRILNERVAKIAKWPVPTDQTGVRAFLGAISITRRWVKNFAELSRPLTRLTGKVMWRWTEAEQLSFELLKIKCSTKASIHGLDLGQTVHLYTDASGFTAGLVVTQFRKPTEALTSGPESKDVEVPILYDSFVFTPTRRKYSGYKRELYAIVAFVVKYDYLVKHPYKPATVHTDHKPLTHFLGSDDHEGIYGHWAEQLRCLNIVIQYIPGPRNKIADALSRTLFDSEYSANTSVCQIRQELTNRGPKWVWKDGKGGFEAFLNSLNPDYRSEVCKHGTIDGLSVFSLGAIPSTDVSWRKAYEESQWFGNTYKFLRGSLSEVPPGLIPKAYDFRIVGDILWIYHKEVYLPCIPEGKVLQVLREAHDKGGHWAKTGTMAKLRGVSYWPNQSQDVERYIAGCIECARHGPATRSQPLNPVLVTFPFQLLGMDFIGPLPETRSGLTYILNVVCYMSTKVIPFATQTNNSSDTIRCLKKVFSLFRKPQAIYCDRGQHFNNAEVRNFVHGEGINITFSPSGASKSTSMIEISNKLIEQVLRKQGTPNTWDEILDTSAIAVNTRVIGRLVISANDVALGPVQETSALSTTLLALPRRDVRTWVADMDNPIQHTQNARTYLQHISEVHDIVKEATKKSKEAMTRRYDRGVQRIVYHLESLVMLHQKNPGKLQPR